MTIRAFLHDPIEFSSFIFLKFLGYSHVGTCLGFLVRWKKWKLKAKSLTANFLGMLSKKTHVFSITLVKFNICPLFKQIQKLPIQCLWFPRTSINPTFYTVELCLGFWRLSTWRHVSHCNSFLRPGYRADLSMMPSYREWNRVSVV